MKNQIRDYNTTADIKMNAKDISKPYLTCLSMMWVFMMFMIIFYIN